MDATFLPSCTRSDLAIISRSSPDVVVALLVKRAAIGSPASLYKFAAGEEQPWYNRIGDTLSGYWNQGVEKVKEHAQPMIDKAVNNAATKQVGDFYNQHQNWINPALLGIGGGALLGLGSGLIGRRKKKRAIGDAVTGALLGGLLGGGAGYFMHQGNQASQARQQEAAKGHAAQTDKAQTLAGLVKSRRAGLIGDVALADQVRKVDPVAADKIMSLNGNENRLQALENHATELQQNTPTGAARVLGTHLAANNPLAAAAAATGAPGQAAVKQDLQSTPATQITSQASPRTGPGPVGKAVDTLADTVIGGAASAGNLLGELTSGESTPATRAGLHSLVATGGAELGLKGLRGVGTLAGKINDPKDNYLYSLARQHDPKGETTKGIGARLTGPPGRGALTRTLTADDAGRKLRDSLHNDHSKLKALEVGGYKRGPGLGMFGGQYQKPTWAKSRLFMHGAPALLSAAYGRATGNSPFQPAIDLPGQIDQLSRIPGQYQPQPPSH